MQALLAGMLSSLVYFGAGVAFSLSHKGDQVYSLEIVNGVSVMVVTRNIIDLVVHRCRAFERKLLVLS